MTVTVWDMLLYAGALTILFVTPGPVWLALMARSMTGGLSAAWPLALGVAVGDVIWSLAAIIGVSWFASEVQGFITFLRYGASVVFLVLGWSVIRHASDQIEQNRRLTRPGRLAGFMAGVAVILSNPKAILFYAGVLPGFFDLGRVTALDMAAIAALSFVVPLLGNLCLAAFIDRMRRYIASATVMRRVNLTAGTLLILVGLILPFI